MTTCRLCLCKSEQNEIVFVIDESQLHLRIKECVSIEINHVNNLPKSVCKICIKKVDDWFEFREMCLNSDELLKAVRIDIYANEVENSNPVIKRNTTIKNESDYKEELWQISPCSDAEESDCEKDFLNEENIVNLDEDTKVSLVENTYKCEFCSLEFDYFLGYLEHQDKHNGQLVFKCDKCTEVFTNKKELSEHERSHKLPCRLCGKMILRSSMKLHVNQHTDKFRCSKCSHCFNSKATLKQHVITVHTDIKDHICETCGKRFSSKTAMNVHIKSHRDERMYSCKLCSYAGRTSSAIYIHMSKHANEVHVCEFCSKSFKSARNLNDHLRRVHSREKRHICSWCQKKFVDKYMLSVHMRIHTGVRPYKCNVCEKTFIRSDSLKEHMQTHDKNTFYECKDCTKKFTSKRGKTRHRCSNGS